MTYTCPSCDRGEAAPGCLNDSRCEGRTIPAIQFETAEEARKDRAHAEAYYRQAEKMLTANERTLHAEIERLQTELKGRHQRQHDAEALAGEYLMQRDDARAELAILRPLTTYVMPMGAAGEKYLNSIAPWPHPLPTMFRWEECFNAMLEAGRREAHTNAEMEARMRAAQRAASNT